MTVMADEFRSKIQPMLAFPMSLVRSFKLLAACQLDHVTAADESNTKTDTFDAKVPLDKSLCLLAEKLSLSKIGLPEQHTTTGGKDGTNNQQPSIIQNKKARKRRSKKTKPQMTSGTTQTKLFATSQGLGDLDFENDFTLFKGREPPFLLPGIVEHNMCCDIGCDWGEYIESGDW